MANGIRLEVIILAKAMAEHIFLGWWGEKKTQGVGNSPKSHNNLPKSESIALEGRAL